MAGPGILQFSQTLKRKAIPGKKIIFVKNVSGSDLGVTQQQKK